MSIRTITSQEFKETLAREPDLRLIDVRFPAEFRQVHVVGAKNIPLNRLTAERLESVLNGQENGTTYFICKGGVRSRRACEKALGFGLSDVVNVEGGTDACVAAGLPTESDRRAFTRERQVRIVAGGLALVGGILSMADHPYWAGLAAFIGAGLLLTGLTNTCPTRMLLAKMPWKRK